MSRIFIAGVLALGAFTLAHSLSALAGGEKAGSKANPTDVEFLQMAAAGHNADIQLGRLAQLKGANADVKSFAGRLVKDHEAAYAELAKLLKNRKLAILSGLEWQNRDDAKKLLVLKGDEFDRLYVETMVRHHEKDETAYDNQAKNGKEDDVKTYASSTLPGIRQHLKEARTLQKTVGQGQNGTK